MKKVLENIRREIDLITNRLNHLVTAQSSLLAAFPEADLVDPIKPAGTAKPAKPRPAPINTHIHVGAKPAAKTKTVSTVSSSAANGPTVVKMVRDAITKLDGPFTVDHIRPGIIKKYPSCEQKIRNGMAVTMKFLQEHGEVTRTDENGIIFFQRVGAATPSTPSVPEPDGPVNRAQLEKELNAALKLRDDCNAKGLDKLAAIHQAKIDRLTNLLS